MEETGSKIPDDVQKEAVSEETYELSGAWIKEVGTLLDAEDIPAVVEMVAPLHEADIAELLNTLTGEKRLKLIDIIRTDFDPVILTYLDEEVRDEVISYLGAQETAAAIAKLDTDDAVHVIGDLSEEEQQAIVDALPEVNREDIKEGLAYPESSAGRLMQKKLVSVPEYWNVGDTIDFLRKSESLPSDFYVIFVMDPRFRPVGSVLLSRIMQSKRDVSIKDIMNEDLKILRVDMDQEEVAFIFRKYGLVEAPVINNPGRLVGVITVDDVVDVIQEEGEEDLMRLGGVSDHDFHAGLLNTVKRRFPWLLVNLMTATLASQVIKHFEGTIEHLVTLAVLMPIIASIGGNAGIQAVTVGVRAIATRDLKTSNAWPILRKEIMIGLVNGFSLAILTGATVLFFYNNVGLACTFALAIIVNLFVAGLAGALIPMMLYRLRLDPAVASGIFLTMLTDMTGFFSFLGIASLILMH